MRRALAVAACWSVVTLLSTAGAWACSCLARDSRAALDDAEAAFVGTLAGRDEPTPTGGLVNSGQVVGYHFSVERWVKGDHGPRITVHSALSGATCGLGGSPGQRMGVLLDRDEQGQWRSGLCSRLTPEDLLGAARFPVVPAALATVLLAAVATAARRSVRRSGWTAAHGTLR